MTACLYVRMGGAAAVTTVVDDKVDRLASNPLLVEIFYGWDLPRLKALGVSLLSAWIGGPSGTDVCAMELPGASLRFSSKELHAALGGMTDALREQGICGDEACELVSLIQTAGFAPPLP